MKRNKHRRVIGVLTVVCAVVGVGFAIPGTVEFMIANGLFGNSPESGVWYFAQAQWWLGLAAVGLFAWLATGAVVEARRPEKPTSESDAS